MSFFWWSSLFLSFFFFDQFLISSTFVLFCPAHLVRATDSYLFLFSTCVCGSYWGLFFPILLHDTLQNSCGSFCSVFSFPLCFFFFLLLSSLFKVWSFGCVLVPGTLAFHLLYLDELWLFGLLCFTVFDYIVTICISLGWRISTDSGCTNAVG